MRVYKKRFSFESGKSFLITCAISAATVNKTSNTAMRKTIFTAISIDKLYHLAGV